MLASPARSRHTHLTAALLVAALGACASGTEASLLPVRPQTVVVNGAPLVLTLLVSAGSPANYVFAFDAPSVPAPITARISGNEFLWTPLASHTGAHEFTFLLRDRSGAELDRTSTLITVVAAADAAPRFGPEAGRTFDLTRNGRVEFDVNVFDDDSASVTIRARGSLPRGATLEQTGPKRAHFDWEPEPDQVDSQLVWRIGLEAVDADHPPVEKDFVIRLLRDPKDDCPGLPPTATLLSPAPGARVTGAPGFRVTLGVTDDHGPIRDAPVLYYTNTPPTSREEPDVAEFDGSAEFALGAGDAFTATIPDPGLAAGEERTFYAFASVTDNDDEAGTLCDHRVDTPVLEFVAVGDTAGTGLEDCAPCTASIECTSGLCITGAGGPRCLPRCNEGGACARGTCGPWTNTEGGTVDACGDIATACDAGGSCADDAHEPNDALVGAPLAPTTLLDGMLCAANEDYYRVEAPANARVEVTLAFAHEQGDLDLQLLAADETVLERSAGTTGTEAVSHCAGEDETFFIRVYGYNDAQNTYALDTQVVAGACTCYDDAGEDDDSRDTPRLPAGSIFDGTICAGDDDYIAVDVSGPASIDATLGLDPAVGDLDLELFAPDGTSVASSRGTGETEHIAVSADVSGRYVLRVYGYGGAGGAYTGDLYLDPVS